MSNLPANVTAELDRILRRTIGAGADGVRLLGQRHDYWVVEAAGVIVKLAGPEASEPSFEAASRGHRLAQELTAVPMSRPLAVDDSCQHSPFRFSVQTRVEGVQWAVYRTGLDEVGLAAAHYAIGAAAAELHAPRFPGFGRFGEAETTDPVEALRQHAARIVRSPSGRNDILAVLERMAPLFDIVLSATICHEDLHGFNLLFADGPEPKLAAVLDFDKAWSGPAESDLARLELWTGMTGPAFWRAYFERHELLPGYDERRDVYQLLWCHEFAVDSPEHLATTNSLRERLELPAIDRF